MFRAAFAYAAALSASVQYENVHAKGSVRAEHDRLLDVAGTRGSGDEVDRPRQTALVAAYQRERLFHPRDDAVAADDGDVRVDQQRSRGRRLRAREEDERARL